MNDATAIQLRLLRELSDALDAAGVDWWLFGGWAMDVYAGEVTRDHSDIEAFVRLEDTDRAREALQAAGFDAWPSLHPEEAQPFTKDGQEVGLWYLVRNERGQIVTPGRWADWPWHPNSFDARAASLGQLGLHAASLECLLDMKTNFAKHPHGAPLREKDIGDIALLNQLMASRDAAD
jgi:hypothetical protein